VCLSNLIKALQKIFKIRPHLHAASSKENVREIVENKDRQTFFSTSSSDGMKEQGK